MDTMEMTKIVGAVCGALLAFLMINWAAEALYHVGADGHGDEIAAAYVIEVDEAGSGGAAEEGPSFEELLAAADAGKGAKVFSKCKACHKLDAGANGTGPTLFAIVGRGVAAEPGFGFSDALVNLGGNWDVARLNEFLLNPKAFAPGTKMSFAGLKKDKDRANLISYLSTIGN